MIIKYILDTDHITLLENGHQQVILHLIGIPFSQRAVTIVSFEEQVQGRLATIRRAKTSTEVVSGYEYLFKTLKFYLQVQVLPYDSAANKIFESLRKEGLRRIGTNDLRIAAIALCNQATVATRNYRDFALVPGLQLVDWSLPTTTF